MKEICPLCNDLHNIQAKLKHIDPIYETLTQQFSGVLHSWEISLTQRCGKCQCIFGEGKTKQKEGVGENQGLGSGDAIKEETIST